MGNVTKDETVKNTLAVDCIFDAPNLNKYKQCKSTEELGNLEPLENGESKGSSCFIPALFLTKVILKEETNESLESIRAIIPTGEEFYRLNATLGDD